MPSSAPTPVSKSFQLCQRVIQDVFTGEYIIFGPMHEVRPPDYPTFVELALFARWTSVHGKYDLEIRVQDLEENVFLKERQGRPLICDDPLVVAVLVMQPLRLYFPKPGKYEIVVLANEVEVVRDVFWAQPPVAPGPLPPSAEN